MTQERGTPTETPADTGGLPTGPRPADRHRVFMDDPVSDHLVRAVVTLAMELSVTRERLASLEAMLADEGIIKDNALAAYVPSDDALRTRGASRDRLIADLIDPLISTLLRIQPD